MPNNALRRIRELDAKRPSIPGEHWLAFAAGVGLWLATRKHPSRALRLAAGMAGSLLVARAASGWDVPSAMRRWMPGAG